VAWPEVGISFLSGKELAALRHLYPCRKDIPTSSQNRLKGKMLERHKVGWAPGRETFSAGNKGV